MLWNASGIRLMATPSRRMTVGLARSAIFYSTTPIGWFAGWLSIPENGSLVAKSFCPPPSWVASIRRDVNSWLD